MNKSNGCGKMYMFDEWGNLENKKFKQKSYICGRDGLCPECQAKNQILKSTNECQISNKEEICEWKDDCSIHPEETPLKKSISETPNKKQNSSEGIDFPFVEKKYRTLGTDDNLDHLAGIAVEDTQTLADKRKEIFDKFVGTPHIAQIYRIIKKQDKQFIDEIKEYFQNMEESGYIVEKGENGWNWEEFIDKKAGKL